MKNNLEGAQIDAWIIADRLRFGRLPMTVIMQEQYVALQRLTRMCYHLIHNLTREKQYFLQHLFFKCSAFTSEVESSVFGNALTELLLEKFSLEEISAIELETLADYLKEKGKNRFPNPENRQVYSKGHALFVPTFQVRRGYH